MGTATSQGGDDAPPFERITEQFKTLVLPSLVAIYAPAKIDCEKSNQVGTGFLIEWRGRPALVTARHVLRGHAFDKGPFEKRVQGFGHMIAFGENPDPLREIPGLDLAVTFFDPLAFKDRLPETCLVASDMASPCLTFGGYLARDFERHRPLLSPAPWSYTNLSVETKAGKVGLLYPHRCNADSLSGEAVVSPRPEGMSGGPMLDARWLHEGHLRLLGVFTEAEYGRAIGEDLDALAQCLALL